jgi:hypothetical protein
MKREHIDVSKVTTSGLHAIKCGDSVSQTLLFTDPAAAVNFAQRFVPALGVQKVAIVPVAVTEKTEKKSELSDDLGVSKGHAKKEYRR